MPDVTLNVLQWNISGYVMNRGRSDPMSHLVRLAIEHDADMIAVNEVCRGQYDWGIDALRRHGWPDDPSNFARMSLSLPATVGGPCWGQDFGQVLYSRRPLGTEEIHDLPQGPMTEMHKVLAAPVLDQPNLVLAVTHLGWAEANVPQLVECRTVMEQYNTDGKTLVLAGDFNAQPHLGRMDTFYHSSLNTPYNSNNRGEYREVMDTAPDPCAGVGPWTGIQPVPDAPCPGIDLPKLDYIWVRNSRIAAPYEGRTLGIPRDGSCVALSDHRPLLGRVTVSVD